MCFHVVIIKLLDLLPSRTEAHCSFSVYKTLCFSSIRPEVFKIKTFIP